MASIRSAILLAWRDRLATLAGWDSQLASGVRANASNARVFAVSYIASEEKEADSNLAYGARLQVITQVVVRMEDADPVLDSGEPLLYLDRMIADAERLVHNPDDWEASHVASVLCRGHDLLEPDERNELEAMLELEFTYRHNLADPDAFNPFYVT